MLPVTEYMLLTLDDIMLFGYASYGVPGSSNPIPRPLSLCIILSTRECWCPLARRSLESARGGLGLCVDEVDAIPSLLLER